MINLLKRDILSCAVSITKLIGYLHLPYSRKKIKSTHYENATIILEEGHILLGTRFGEFSNIFIPGKYKHSAIYIGNNTVVEAVYPQVKKTSLIDFMLSRDLVGIVSPIFCDIDQMKLATRWAIKQLNKSYDLLFDCNDKNWAFYCHELTGKAYTETMNPCPWQPRERFGELTYTGDDFIKSNKWQIIKEFGG